MPLHRLLVCILPLPSPAQPRSWPKLRAYADSLAIIMRLRIISLCLQAVKKFFTVSQYFFSHAYSGMGRVSFVHTCRETHMKGSDIPMEQAIVPRPRPPGPRPSPERGRRAGHRGPDPDPVRKSDGAAQKKRQNLNKKGCLFRQPYVYSKWFTRQKCLKLRCPLRSGRWPHSASRTASPSGRCGSTPRTGRSRKR